MRLSLYQPTSGKQKSFLSFLISKEEVQFICNGFTGGTPKLKIRGTIHDGLAISIGDQGYSLGSQSIVKNFGPDVGAVVQVACAVLGARQSPPLKPPLLITPEKTEDEGHPTLRIKPMPELSLEGAAPFNPAFAIPKEEGRDDTPSDEVEAEHEPAPPPLVLTPPPTPPMRKEQVLAIVARHSHNTPDLSFTSPPSPAPRKPPPWDRPASSPPLSSRTVAMTPAAPPRAPATVTPVAAAMEHYESPAVIPEAPAAENAKIDFRTAIDMVNEAIAHSAGALGITIKEGKLRGFTRKIIEEEL